MKVQINQEFLKAYIKNLFRVGTLAGIAMIPFGLVFNLMGLRINEYGMLVIQSFFGDAPPIVRFILFVIEHFIISWTVAIPLLWVLITLYGRISGLWLSLFYGLLFYVLVNSLLLPALFNDPTPWTLGFNTIYPSLIVHLVYGFTVWWTSKDFVAQYSSKE